MYDYHDPPMLKWTFVNALHQHAGTKFHDLNFEPLLTPVCWFEHVEVQFHCPVFCVLKYKYGNEQGMK